MAKTRQPPVEAVWNENEALEAPTAAPTTQTPVLSSPQRSAQWLAMARGHLADSLRATAYQLTEFAANPILSTMTDTDIQRMSYAVDQVTLIQEAIEAAATNENEGE